MDVPGPVSNFRVYPLSTSEIKIEWDPPQYASGSIRTYRISYHEAGSTAAPQDVDTEKRQYILSSLRPFTEYIVTVVAFNENGPGTNTAEVPAKTYSDAPTGAPENVLIEPTSANVSSYFGTCFWMLFDFFFLHFFYKRGRFYCAFR